MFTKFVTPHTHRLTHLITGFIVFIPVALLLALVLSSGVSAQPKLRTTPEQSIIYYVDAAKTAGANDGASWSDAFTSLQLALDVVQEGDQIWVAQGVYTPSKRTEEGDARSATFDLVNGVALYGGFSGTPGSEGDMEGRDWEVYATVLSGDIDGNDVVDERGVVTDTANIAGENAYHVVMAEEVYRTTLLDGFFITAGEASGGSFQSGGGMHMNFFSSPTLTNINFIANSARGAGGGIYNVASFPRLSNVKFVANSAGGSGGGMSNVGSSTHFSNVSFIGNSAGGDGGGIYNHEDSPTLNHIVITANTAGGDGGGMYNGRGSPTLNNVIITANSAGGDGGGMYNYKGSPPLNNVVIAANSAIHHGGGMHNRYVANPILTNVTFAANSGIDLANTASSKPVIRNSIFWGSLSTVSADSYITLEISDSLVQGGCPASATCSGFLLDTDPYFIRLPDSGDGNWRSLEDNDYGDLGLQAGSPAIDAGYNEWLPPDLTLDVLGSPRIVGGRVDLGAYEATGLKIGKKVAPTVLQPGASITYTLHVHNYSDADTSTDILLSDQLPQEILIDDVKTEGTPITQIGAPPHYVWAIKDLPPLAQGVITLTGRVKTELTPPTDVVNTISVTVETGDAMLSDNMVSVKSHIPGTIYVDVSKTSGANNGSTWSDAFTSLQSALDLAQASDQIWVAQGVYMPSKRSEEEDPRSATFTLINGVALFGGFPGRSGQEGDLSTRDWQTYPTVLSGDIDGNDRVDASGVLTNTLRMIGENAYTVVKAINVGEETLLDGFFITSGGISGNSWVQPSAGGGMLSSSSDIVLDNIVFSGNSAGDSSGGGINCLYGKPILTNVTFSRNSADGPGGGMSSYRSSPILNNVLFSDNRTTGDGDGGGMVISFGSALLNNVTFSGNSAIGNGGGLSTSQGSPVLNKVTVLGNSATGDGGGIFVYNDSSTLANILVVANSAKWRGGGIFIDDSTSTLTNIGFVGNSARYGGAVYDTASIITLTNATLTNNSARFGGAILNTAKSPTATNVTLGTNSARTEGANIIRLQDTLFIHNSIVWQNMGPTINVGSDNHRIVSDSLVQGGCPADAMCIGRLQDVDPSFVRPPDSGDGDWSTMEDNDYGDLRLQADSPAIDAGNNAWLPSDTLDLDGDGDISELIPFDLQSFPRIVGDAVDMGAYEYIELNESLWMPSILR